VLLTLLYKGRQWRIDNEALSIYIYKLCEEQKGDIIDPSLEPLVWAFVKDRIKLIEAVCRTQSDKPVKITETDILQFKQVAKLDGILSAPVEVWLLEYRLLPDCPAGDGQPYMILYHSVVNPLSFTAVSIRPISTRRATCARPSYRNSRILVCI
jgi:hypothetical protein